MKIDPTVRRESRRIALAVLILSALMEAVFLILGRWDYTVLLGNLLGGGAAVLNFFLMGLTIQHAMTLEESEMRARVKLSQTARMMMLMLVGVLGIVLPCFHAVAVVVPFLFPRIAIFVRGLINREP